MLRIRDIFLSLDESESSLPEKCASLLGVPRDDILSLQIHRKSIDARRKGSIRFVYTVDIEVNNEGRLLGRLNNPRVSPAEYFEYRIPRAASTERPVVVGFGPAGMFAALVLAEAGLKIGRASCRERV